MLPTEDITTKPGMEIVLDQLYKFGIADYGVFVVMLIICSLIGLYFGFQDRAKYKDSNHKSGAKADDYFVGGRNLHIAPVAMSLIASYISGITLLGTVTEIYLYGIQYGYVLISFILLGIVMHYIIIPIFHDLKLTSTYEYLESRYNHQMRLFGSFVFAFGEIFYTSIVVYVSALAYSQLTGVDVHKIIPIIMTICIFYTSLGGMKAVVWTDFVQISVTFGVLIFVAYRGTISVGGVSVVLKKNLESGRIELPNFDPDPTIRHSFWTIVIGGTFFWLKVNGFGQTIFQRYLSLKSVEKARKAQKIYITGVIILIGLSCYNGLLVYTKYHDCDPLETKLVKAKDQLLPFLVMDVLRDYPGLPGLFIAGIFSASLSTLSTSLNSLAAVAMEDVFKPYFCKFFVEKHSAFIMRTTVVVFGVLSILITYLIPHLGSILQLSMSTFTATSGPIMGVFLVGMLIPRINKKGVFVAVIASTIFMIYIVTRAQIEISTGVVVYETKPISTDGCVFEFVSNVTSVIQEKAGSSFDKSLHNMSYLYFTAFGTFSTAIIALIYSWIFGFEDTSKIDPMLVAPFLRKGLNSCVPTTEEKEMFQIQTDDVV